MLKGEFWEVFFGYVYFVYIFKSGGVVKKVKVFVRVEKFFVLLIINLYIEGFDIWEGLKLVLFLKDVFEVEIFFFEGVYVRKVKVY